MWEALEAGKDRETHFVLVPPAGMRPPDGTITNLCFFLKPSL